jgi:hypothetical protein
LVNNLNPRGLLLADSCQLTADSCQLNPIINLKITTMENREINADEALEIHNAITKYQTSGRSAAEMYGFLQGYKQAVLNRIPVGDTSNVIKVANPDILIPFDEDNINELNKDMIHDFLIEFDDTYDKTDKAPKSIDLKDTEDITKPNKDA